VISGLCCNRTQIDTQKRKSGLSTVAAVKMREDSSTSHQKRTLWECYKSVERTAVRSLLSQTTEAGSCYFLRNQIIAKIIPSWSSSAVLVLLADGKWREVLGKQLALPYGSCTRETELYNYMRFSRENPTPLRRNRGIVKHHLHPVHPSLQLQRPFKSYPKKVEQKTDT
jgi:hypothetical protein